MIKLPRRAGAGAPKLDDRKRQRVESSILKALFENPQGLTWTEIEKRMLRAKVCNTQALSKYLKGPKGLVSLGAIVYDHESKLYKLNPWATQQAFPFTIRVKGIPAKIETVSDLFAQIDLEFELAYFEYIGLLQRIVSSPNAGAARRRAEFSFNHKINPRLTQIAQWIWENHHTEVGVKIADVDPVGATILFRPQYYLFQPKDYVGPTFSIIPPHYHQKISAHNIEKLSVQIHKAWKEDTVL